MTWCSSMTVPLVSKFEHIHLLSWMPELVRRLRSRGSECSPLYSITLHVLGRRLRASCETSWTILAFVLEESVMYHLARRSLPWIESSILYLRAAGYVCTLLGYKQHIVDHGRVNGEGGSTNQTGEILVRAQASARQKYLTKGLNELSALQRISN